MTTLSGHDGHEHPHEHGSLPSVRMRQSDNRRRLALAMAIGAVILVAELVGGFLSGALVLYSDAAHVFTDLSALLLALLATGLAMRPATAAKSYGFHRAEVVAAFVNALALWVVSAFFVYEAIRRLRAPPSVDANVLLVVAAGTLVANAAMAFVLGRGAGDNVNVKSAYLHVLSDALGSLAALAAGLAIRLRGWTWADPLATLFVSALIVVWTWRLTRETLHILLEGTPARMDTDRLRRDVLAVPGVLDVHDLHVWTLTTGMDSMSAHVRVADVAHGPDVARAIRTAIKGKYDLGHMTLEVEAPNGVCEACD